MKLKEINEYEELLRSVKEHLLDKRNCIIAIEGFTLSGKTYLGNRLSKDLGCSLLSTDEYVIERGGNFYWVDRLNLSLLSDNINRSLQKNQLTIIEGICLRDTLNRIHIEPSLYVYVKSLTKTGGLWHGGLNLEEFQQNQDFKENIFEPDLSAFKYHLNEQFRPHERANIIFSRIDE